MRSPGGSQPSGPAEPEAAAGLLPPRITKLALWVVGVAAISAWLLLAVAHLHDRYAELHVQGAWMALARYANEGTLYPPLYDGLHYGGTRWMPLPILLNAGAARLTGEYLTSGKLVGLALTSLLLIEVFVFLRRSKTPTPLAVALTGSIVATLPGRAAGTSIGGDVLPVVLQVGSVMLATWGRKRFSLVAAGVLAGLAFASKTTGVWAFLAICVWLAIDRRWRDIAVFAGAFVATAIAVLGVVEVVSHGRFGDNLLTLTFAGVGEGVGPIRAPNQLVYQLATYGIATWILLPFAVVAAFSAGGVRRIPVTQFALGWAILLLLVSLTDVGAGYNQLLDVTVLTVLVVGQLAGRSDFGSLAAATGATMTVVIVWGTISGILLTLVPDVRATVEGSSLGYPVRPLVNLIGPSDQIVSEDPYVPISFGQDPVVLDPFMLRRLDAVDPTVVNSLIDRIDRHEFAYLVTIEPLNASDGAGVASDLGDTVANDYWWSEFHFGLRVVGAMRREYEFDGIIDQYFVYRPRT